jgi:hypothetical protein
MHLNSALRRILMERVTPRVHLLARTAVMESKRYLKGKRATISSTNILPKILNVIMIA